MANNFWIVDTFNKNAFHGSPSAVFFVDTLDNEELFQNIAMEINTPDTIFVKDAKHNNFEVLCFSPNCKGMFFGNCLFAASEVILKQNPNLPEFNLIHGNIIYNVTKQEDGQIRVIFSSAEINKASMPASLHSALDSELIVSIAESDMDLIVEIRSPKRVFNMTPNMDSLKTLEYDTVILTADTHYEVDMDYDFCARVFAPNIGIFNDIVSPKAHSKLAAYWVDRMGKNKLIGYQSSDIREGYTNALYEDEFTYISGNCVITAVGEMLIKNL